MNYHEIFFFPDYIEDPYSPRIAAVNFLIKLVSEDEKTNLQKFIRFIAEIFRRYLNTSPFKFCYTCSLHGPS